MPRSYVQEFAKIASVEDVHGIYELARLQKEAAKLPFGVKPPGGASKLSKEMVPVTAAEAEEMAPTISKMLASGDHGVVTGLFNRPSLLERLTGQKK